MQPPRSRPELPACQKGQDLLQEVREQWGCRRELAGACSTVASMRESAYFGTGSQPEVAARLLADFTPRKTIVVTAAARIGSRIQNFAFTCLKRRPLTPPDRARASAFPRSVHVHFCYKDWTCDEGNGIESLRFVRSTKV